MSFLPSTAVTKLGLASTFILGVAVGNKLKNHMNTSSHFIHKERRHLHISSIHKKDFNLKKQCDIISVVHNTLQNYWRRISTEESVTNFYVDRARKLCHVYLSSMGVIEISTEIVLEKWFEASEGIDNTDYWAPLPSLHQDPPSYESALFSAAIALWHISCINELCRAEEFVDSNLLRILKQVIEEKDMITTPVVLKILANLSAVKDNHKDFTKTGLVDVLNVFSESPHPELFLPAWRGLHNLKQSNEEMVDGQEVYVEGVYVFNPPYLDKNENPLLDIVLVHGIKGSASWTWREHDQGKSKRLISQEQRRNMLNGNPEDVDALYTCCWPIDWLMPSLSIPVRILAVDFDAEWQVSGSKYPVEARGKTVSQHAEHIAESLKAARVGDRPIVWITHSMGGLIVKQMIVNHFKQFPLDKELVKDQSILQDRLSCNKLAKQTLGVVFYSVPHHGTPLASYVSKPILRQLLQPTVEVCEMEEDPCIGTFHEVDASHRDICKPISRKSESYQKVEDFIQDIIKKL
ncbi:protein SERAC1-like isoform X2 [Palaemon carinicauda]|uniref:protein SERAC1-like isoform X2 n=1 Tax=Palaemon carinicauda TaxID=392227 RepID=UPI0035B639D9